MKMNTTLLFGLGLCGALLAACSSSDHPDASLPPVAIPQTPQSLETAQVLSLAEKPSETGSPFTPCADPHTFGGSRSRSGWR
jgi:hypothetical protein